MRNLKSSSHLGFSESSCFVPQFRTLPFRFVDTGLHAVHPTGKLSNIILVTCPLRKSSFKLTERHWKGQESTLRGLRSPICLVSVTVCSVHPTRRKPLDRDAGTWAGMGWAEWSGPVQAWSGALVSITSGSKGQLSPSQQAEKWDWTQNLESVTSHETVGEAYRQTGKLPGARLLWSRDSEGRKSILNTSKLSRISREDEKRGRKGEANPRSKKEHCNNLAWDLKFTKITMEK